jgi:plastocyanin
MNKKTKQKDVRSKMIFSKGMIIMIAAAVVIVSIIVYFGMRSLTPVNGNSPVFAAPTNTFIKATYSPQSGYTFTSQSTSSGRNSLPVGYNSPTITLKQGELASIHLINEDTNSKHNLNIDAFKVHTNNLGYFQSQSILFVANKAGSFPYYCTIHPEMKGVVIVQ